MKGDRFIMKKNGSNYYFNNYEELVEFLLNKGFKYEIPEVDKEDLEEGRRAYAVEIREDKIMYCAVEKRSGGGVYNQDVFYDNAHAYRFNLNDIMTFPEASKIWGLGESTLRSVVKQDRLKEGIDYRKSGSSWLITKAAMIKLYGEPSGKDNTEKL